MEFFKKIVFMERVLSRQTTTTPKRIYIIFTTGEQGK